jgi:hypothetical protein
MFRLITLPLAGQGKYHSGDKVAKISSSKIEEATGLQVEDFELDFMGYRA